MSRQWPPAWVRFGVWSKQLMDASPIMMRRTHTKQIQIAFELGVDAGRYLERRKLGVSEPASTQEPPGEARHLRSV